MKLFSLFKKKPAGILTPPGANYWKICKRFLSGAHCLIAGATGCGKSTLLNSMLYTLLAIHENGTALYLVDPKRVELVDYSRLQFCAGYTTTAQGTVNLLKSVVELMEIRYQIMARDHLKMSQDGPVYVVVDELADLMISAYKKDIRELLQKLLQLGRAANIHIIACTQAPSRRVIPAELTLNFTDRIALRCQSNIESKQICGVSGAEKLPRHGRGIYASPDGMELVDIPMTPQEDIDERINWYLNQK